MSTKTQAAANETWSRTVAALAALVERVTPWLLDLGNWIFGALTAFNLLILSALLTIGPADTAVLVATGGLALALPIDVAGFVLLRLAADLKNVDLGELASSEFAKAGFRLQEVSAPDPQELEKRRARVVLRYSYALLALAALATLVGVTGALWHMAWWIAVLFIAMVVVSQLVIFRAFMATSRRQVWTAPDGSVEPR